MTQFRQINGVTVPLPSKESGGSGFCDIESYTRKTQCSKCGQAIFFHKAENGGKVSFDELGAPWQVHGCFQQNSVGSKKSHINKKAACILYLVKSSKTICVSLLGYASKRGLCFPIDKTLRDKFLRYHRDAPMYVEVIKKDDCYELILDTYLQTPSYYRSGDQDIETVYIKYTIAIDKFEKYISLLRKKTIAGRRSRNIVARLCIAL